MKCANNYCIFQDENKCLKEEIELDSHGNCENMTFPCMPKDFLAFYKSDTRNKIKDNA